MHRPSISRSLLPMIVCGFIAGLVLASCIALSVQTHISYGKGSNAAISTGLPFFSFICTVKANAGDEITSEEFRTVFNPRSDCMVGFAFGFWIGAAVGFLVARRGIIGAIGSLLFALIVGGAGLLVSDLLFVEHRLTKTPDSIEVKHCVQTSLGTIGVVSSMVVALLAAWWMRRQCSSACMIPNSEYIQINNPSTVPDTVA